MNPKKRAVFPCRCVAGPPLAAMLPPHVNTTKARSRKRRRLLKDVFVELSTPKGKVFSGRASAVEFSPANAVVQLEPGRVSYIGLISSGELVLRIGTEFRFFALFQASARLLGHHLTILAEIAEPITEPLRNCGNPVCDCLAILLRRRSKLRSKR